MKHKNKKKYPKWPYILVGSTVVVILWAATQTNTTIYQIPHIQQVQAMVDQGKSTEEIIKELKGEVLDAIATCETGNSTSSDGMIIFDSNNEASIGRFMFQRKTVIAYYKLFYNKDISNQEAISIAIDKNKAKELAEKIVFEDNGKGINNWYNCNQKLGLKAKVDIIKDIMEKAK